MEPSIRAEDIRNAIDDFASAREGDFRAAKASSTLDRLADSYRFGGAGIDCDDSAERDEIIRMLSDHGSESFTEYMYGD